MALDSATRKEDIHVAPFHAILPLASGVFRPRRSTGEKEDFLCEKMSTRRTILRGERGLTDAIEEVKSGASVRDAASQLNIAQSTLHYHFTTPRTKTFVDQQFSPSERSR